MSTFLIASFCTDLLSLSVLFCLQESKLFLKRTYSKLFYIKLSSSFFYYLKFGGVSSELQHIYIYPCDMTYNEWSLSFVLACWFLYWKWSVLQKASNATSYFHVVDRNSTISRYSGSLYSDSVSFPLRLYSCWGVTDWILRCFLVEFSKIFLRFKDSPVCVCVTDYSVCFFLRWAEAEDSHSQSSAQGKYNNLVGSLFTTYAKTQSRAPLIAVMIVKQLVQVILYWMILSLFTYICIYIFL